MFDAAKTNTLLNRPLELPCGAILKNRLLKSAMSDSLGNGEGDPTDAQIRLYERWAQGGTALSIIGEVQVDPRFPEKPGNLVLHQNSNFKAMRSLAVRASTAGTHIWPQLGHAGALAYPAISQATGPSALKIGDFQCEGMSKTEIEQLPNTYAEAAVVAQKVGFTGVQLHAGHGFLLSQFLSPLFNRRTDRYGGSIENRSRIIIEVIAKIRRAVGPKFPIAIKVNSSDQLEGGLTQADALKVIKRLNNTSVDLIELSGGTYFPGAKSSSDSAAGGPYFINFAKLARGVTNIPLVVTGGYKNRVEAIQSLSNDAVDMIGIARAMVLNPSLANDWIQGKSDPKFPQFKSPPTGGITAWYTMLINALGQDAESSFDIDLPSAIRLYEARDEERCHQWRTKFSHRPLDVVKK